MRIALTIIGLFTCLPSMGCALLEDTGRNVIVGVRSTTDEIRESHRNRRWANEAWSRVPQNEAYSEHHEEGFKDGFTEYLYRGGNGEPPLMAPARYRGIRYQTVEGHQAVQDWFAGYRHGSAAAHSSGLRQLIVNTTSLHAAPYGGPQEAFAAPLAWTHVKAPATTPVPLARTQPTDKPATEGITLPPTVLSPAVSLPSVKKDPEPTATVERPATTELMVPYMGTTKLNSVLELTAFNPLEDFEPAIEMQPRRMQASLGAPSAQEDDPSLRK